MIFNSLRSSSVAGWRWWKPETLSANALEYEIKKFIFGRRRKREGMKPKRDNKRKFEFKLKSFLFGISLSSSLVRLSFILWKNKMEIQQVGLLHNFCFILYHNPDIFLAVASRFAACVLAPKQSQKPDKITEKLYFQSIFRIQTWISLRVIWGDSEISFSPRLSGRFTFACPKKTIVRRLEPSKY